MSNHTESRERALKALHEAADALVPGIDDRRHPDLQGVSRARMRRVRQCGDLVDAWIDVAAHPEFVPSDPNVEPGA